MVKVLLQRVAIIFLVAVTAFATLGLGTCGAEAGKTLNILTINLMLINPYLDPYNPDLDDWPKRAETLVSFVQGQAQAGKPVDFILCQEGHGGELAKLMGGRGNTIRDLKRRLQKAGLTYYAASAVSFENFETAGFPIKSNYLVGVLSRYPIKTVKRGKLTCDAAIASEPNGRKAIACETKVPGIGRVTCFSAHLADACGGTQDQADQLMAFANRVAKQHPADLYILGGDFNAGDESDLYRYLTEQIHLIDTFAAVNAGDPGYTVVNPGNLYSVPTDPPQVIKSRIDYIFAIYGKQNPGHPTAQPLGVQASRVVLNDMPLSGNVMSDHYGVLSQIIVTPPYGGKPIKGIFAPPVPLPLP